MDLKQGIEILQSNVTFRTILATLLAVGSFLNGAEVSFFVYKPLFYLHYFTLTFQIISK